VTQLGQRARDHLSFLVSGVALLLLHLPTLGRYASTATRCFVECGKRLAAGYVDHPPFVPLMARIACEIGGCGSETTETCVDTCSSLRYAGI
jgi:hypothetical protein